LYYGGLGPIRRENGVGRIHGRRDGGLPRKKWCGETNLYVHIKKDKLNGAERRAEKVSILKLGVMLWGV